MIIAKVDLRIVAENGLALNAEVQRIKALDSTYVRGWLEFHYGDGQVPRSDANREALLMTKAKRKRLRKDKDESAE